eukprot:3350591-Rhodomonas_salina.3
MIAVGVERGRAARTVDVAVVEEVPDEDARAPLVHKAPPVLPLRVEELLEHAALGAARHEHSASHAHTHTISKRMQRESKRECKRSRTRRGTRKRQRAEA